jgi:hypothetical protein
MLKHVPAAAGPQRIAHIPQPIVDLLNFRGLCLKECIPAGRRTMRVLRIVSFGDHFPLASAKRSVPQSRHEKKNPGREAGAANVTDAEGEA